jgi:hypothetical protein
MGRARRNRASKRYRLNYYQHASVSRCKLRSAAAIGPHLQYAHLQEAYFDVSRDLIALPKIDTMDLNNRTACQGGFVFRWHPARFQSEADSRYNTKDGRKFWIPARGQGAI